MSDPLDDLKLPRRQPTSRTLLWSLWGRETVKDLVLLLAALPAACTLLLVPVVATSGGSWPRLLGLLVLFVALWWLVRVLLRRWVAAGDARDDARDGADEAGDPPSRG